MGRIAHHPDRPAAAQAAATSSSARLCLSGDVDAIVAADLRDAVLDLLRAAPAHVELDLNRVGFLDAAGVTALLRCRSDAQETGCRLTLCNTGPAVHRVLQIVGLLETFGVPVRQPVRTH